MGLAIGLLVMAGFFAVVAPVTFPLELGLCAVLFAVFGALVLYYLERTAKAWQAEIKADLSAGRKAVVHGPLEEKWDRYFENQATYNVKVRGETFVVDLTTFTRFDVGDPVRVFVAPRTRTLLRVEPASTRIDSGQRSVDG